MEINGLGISTTPVAGWSQPANKAPENKDAATAAVQQGNDQVTVSLSSVKPDDTKTPAVEDKTQVTAKSVEQKTEGGQVDKKAQEQQYEKNYTKAYFAIDDITHSVVIRVADYQGKVIRQIPPEDYLKMAETMKKTQESLFSTKA
ncbi:MAG: flagellar protein FlaG [Nitrospirae bacterium]|nr:flagellar protein FlaG [Nitrospirota bacterium]